MSGIAAMLRHDGGPVSSRVLDAILARMERRGPDGVRVTCEGAIGMGRATLLAAREDDVDDQPRASRDGARCIVADARLDNRDELLGALDLDARATDAAILLASYERWGDGCAARLLGDFAFVVWDARSRSIFAARDQIGVRPLYYVNDAATFRCASEKFALLADPEVSSKPCAESLALFLVEEYVERDRTLYDAVRSLPPGSSLRVANGEARESSYYRPDLGRRIEHARSSEYAEQFRATLRSSVRARLRARGPVACHLSGGLDSSSVSIEAELAFREGAVADRPVTVHAAYPGLACDEAAYAEAVAKRWSLPMISVTPPGGPLTDASLRGVVPDVYCEPGARVWTRMFDVAKENGARVLLTGCGSDQVMRPTGFELFDAVRSADVRSIDRLLGLGRRPFVARETVRRVRDGVRPLVPERIRASIRRLRGRERTRPWLTKSALGVVEEARKRTRRAPRPSDARDRSTAAFFTDVATGYEFLLMLAHTGQLAASSGVEIRHPFLDRRVVELMLAFPHEERCGGDLPKSLLRRAMHDDLPPLVRDRTDFAIFEPYLHRALVLDNAPLLAELFRESRLESLGLVDREGVQNLLNQARIDWFLCRDVINVTSLELWIRRCIP